MEREFEENPVFLHLKRKMSPFYEKIVTLYGVCDNILSEIPKTFSNYTLHDISHSIRVINYMTDFIADRIDSFSDLHLAMLLSAGLLHDTGMFVSDRERDSLLQRLQDQNRYETLSPREQLMRVQNHVRDHHGERVGAVLDQEYTSGATIRSLFQVGTSYNVAETVVAICRSHTESCEWITENLRAEEAVGYDVANPQQLALLLRLGDALDIDDRRAPWLLYNLLNPQGLSDSEWKKHIPITNYNKVTQEEGAYVVTFSGSCSEIQIHREVISYLDWLSGDMEKINRMLSRFRPPFSFRLRPPVVNAIQTVGFESSNLRFQLSYEQIAGLLMGENIYGNRKHGLRELLQNAIDAVLLMKNICDRRGDHFYQPAIELELDKNTNRVILLDNGVGMSADILKKYFFNIGVSYYTSSDFKWNAYEYSPIGHYGIGFLAAFMLSSHVTMETKYYQATEMLRVEFDRASPYIHLAHPELHDFPRDHGTRVILEYDQVIGGVFQDEAELVNYIRELLLTDGYSLYVKTSSGRQELRLSLKRNCCVSLSSNDFDLEYEWAGLPVFSTSCSQLTGLPPEQIVILQKDIEFDPYLDTPCNTLDYLYELANNLELFLQKNPDISLENLWQDKTGEYAETHKEERDALFDLVTNVGLDLYGSVETDADIKQQIDTFALSRSYAHGCFRWFDVPYIADNEHLSGFQDKVDECGYKHAMSYYRPWIQFFSVFEKDSFLEEQAASQELLDPSDMFLQLMFVLASQADYSYFYEYPFQPILREREAVMHPCKKVFLAVDNDCDFHREQVDFKVYLKGVWVHDVNIVLPKIALGTKLKRLYLNLKSDLYETNVARNDLTEASLSLLVKQLVTALYGQFLAESDELVPPVEKDLIRCFLQKYYP